MRTLFIIFLFGLFSHISFSQTQGSISDVRNIFDEKGDYYFDKKEYKKAIVYYNMAYKADAKNYYSILKKAEAYTSLGLYDQAAECYRVIFNTKLYIPNEYRMQFAFLLLKNKDIVGFEKWMGIYNEIVRSEISDYLTGTEVRAKMYKDSSVVILENESVLNTTESEISPSVYKDKVVFASTRKNLAANAGNDYYNLYSANYLDDGHLGRLNTFNNSLNSTQNESAVAFSDKTGKVYITRGSSVHSNLKTYEAKIPATMNDFLSLKGLSVGGSGSIGHITFNSEGTRVYFVSDASGGSGGLDIYSSDWENGTWSSPKNLGPKINTAKDEMYPFVLHDSILYFTSAGHNGQGGFDLYSVNLNHENRNPKNLGSAVNSKYDDYGLAFSANGLTGYFCSNRPGGFGREDIYRVHLLDIKVKLPAYRFKRKSFMEDDKINLYLSDGDEYNIASEDKAGFNFGFQPDEPYKMVIQHENPLATNIIYSTKLTPDQKQKAFLYPEPFEKTEIRLQTGMRYQFTAGMKPISTEYKNALDVLSKEYQGGGSSAIDLTALAKELQLNEGEIYTIRFVKDDSRYSDEKLKGESGLFVNNETIGVSGRSFFIVLPLDIEANFNIKTDIGHFKESFNPKKTGKVSVDAEPVIKETPVKESEGFPILVNTEEFSQAGRTIKATELTIIPGSMYILTLKRTDPRATRDQELFIPLTKGVKYNLGTEAESKEEYMKAVSQMSTGQGKPNEELIDISVLSKELDIMSEKDIVFSLVPAQKMASQATDSRNILTTLAVDGRKYYITNVQRLQVKLKLEQNKTVNIQTDLTYVKENFDPSTIKLDVDTTSVSRDIITDPVFDVIVVNFDLNAYALRPDAKSIVTDKVIQVLKGDSRLYVTIKGYTDPLGDDDYNEKLSRNRAQTVKDFLANNGIGEGRIRTFSFGETQSLKEGESWEDLTEEDLKKHRKVEIVIYLPKSEEE